MPEVEILQFDKETAERIVNTVHRLEGMYRNLVDEIKNRPNFKTLQTFKVRLSSTIPATTIADPNTNPIIGKGTAYILDTYEDGASTKLRYYKPDGSTLKQKTVLNLFDIELPVGTHAFAVQDWKGTLWIVAANCP